MYIGPSDNNEGQSSEEGNHSIQFTDSFPLVQIVGNKRIILEHYSRVLSASGRYEVRYRSDV